MVNGSQFSAGVGGENKRWSYAKDKGKVKCPWCFEEVAPHIIRPKKEKKKVPLSVLYCPHCEEVWQHRGEIRTAEVECPTCKHKYNPEEGNIPAKGKYICRGTCNGNVDKIISSIRSLPTDQLLTLRPYALEGYCEKCAGKEKVQRTPHGEEVSKLFFQIDEVQNVKEQTRKTDSILSKNNGKFFKRFTSADLVQYQNAKDIWEKEKVNLPYPKSEIPVGAETQRLLEHHYNYWHQMFNDRQLLTLATLLNAIDQENDSAIKDFLLVAFSASTERNNMFCRFFDGRNTIQGSFDRHDYASKLTPAENSILGSTEIRGTYANMFSRMVEGIKYRENIYDYKIPTSTDKNKYIASNEKIVNHRSELLNGDSSEEITKINKGVELIITDPPYAGNVNYSELSDFFYVWLRLSLSKRYIAFSPELAPKSKEIIENRSRGLSNHDFRDRLKAVFENANKKLTDDGLCVFTYHHAGDQQWIDLLEAVNNAQFIIECVYPIHGEKESSLLLQNTEGISYDLIHVCKKRTSETIRKRSWAGVRQEIRQRAKEETKLIESGKYGGEKLSPSDINILLIGKCLELYSKHYGAIVDYQDKPVPLHEALKGIKMMVDQLITKERELPSELENIDVPSYIYFTALFRIKEIKVDEVSKSVRGIIEPSELREHGLIIKRRESRDRTFYVKQPLERLNDLKMKFNETGPIHQPDLFGGEGTVLPTNILLVDVMHLLLGITETGDNLLPWLEKFSGLRPQIRAAMEYFIKNDRFTSAAKRVLSLIDERSLFTIESK